MRKIIYIAGDDAEHAAAEIRQLQLVNERALLCVAAKAGTEGELARLTGLRPEQIVCYGKSSVLLVWRRLAAFSRPSQDAQVIFPAGHACSRILKLLALALPGRLMSFDGRNLHHIGRTSVLWAVIDGAIAGSGPLCVVGSASPNQLGKTIEDLRKRYPGVPICGALPDAVRTEAGAWFDSVLPVTSAAQCYERILSHCFGPRRFRALIVPCTNEGRAWMKWLSFWLPIWRVEVYNENMDVFSGRNLRRLGKHAIWRRRQHSDICREQREYERSLLPVGVVGSASGYYLRKIVPALRSRFPHAELHGVLNPDLHVRSQELFDSVTVLEGDTLHSFFQWCKLLQSGRKFQCWVIPCTNEPYSLMKFLAMLLPLNRRNLYNELADGFPIRKWGMLYRHMAWRARDHLSFQIVTGTAGKSAGVRLVHLIGYSFRLLAAVPVLWNARRRARLQAAGVSGSLKTLDTIRSVDLIRMNTGGAGEPERFSALLSEGKFGSLFDVSSVIEMKEAIRDSRAEFICLLDSRCKMLEKDWLDRLLEAFDEQTAQVGPQVVGHEDGSLIRGGLFTENRAPHWNSDHAVCWHRRMEWLSVEMLPAVCIILRRRAFLEAGFLSAANSWPVTVTSDFCMRLAARGWRSICNQSVTALFPGGTQRSPALEQPRTVGLSEDIS